MEHLSLSFFLVLGFCMALSFLLSGMESGLFAVSRLRIRKKMRSGNPKAKILYAYLENSENFLWTILVGNTLANLTFYSLLAVVLYPVAREKPLYLLGGYLAVVFLFYIFCELLPKMLFRLFPNRLCLLFVGVFRIIHLLLTPLVRLVAWFCERILRLTGGGQVKLQLFTNRDELRFLTQESAGQFTTEETSMILRVLDLQKLTVRQVTTPMDKAVTVQIDTPLTEVMRICHEHNLTRLPVWRREEKGRRRIAGIISLSTFIYEAEVDKNRLAGELVRPALFLSESTRLEEALRRMQRSGRRQAIVLGRDQQEIGLVTLTDILKVIFGEVSL